MKKIIATILLLVAIIPVYSIIAPSESPMLLEICAQESLERGNNCVENFGSCDALDVPGTDYSNFLGDLQSGVINWRGDANVQQFISTVRASNSYGARANDYCYVKGSIKDITEVALATIEGNASDLPGIGFDNLNATVFIGRACQPGFIPSRANQNVWGCCPSGYKLVARSEEARYQNTSEGSGCCLTLGAPSTPDHYDQNKSDYQRCVNSAGNPVWSTASVVRNGVTLQTFLPTTGAVNSFPIGVNSGTMVYAPQTQASKKCPTNSQCTIQQSGGILNVEDPAVYESDVNAVCGRCFTTGDVIGTSVASPGATDNPITDVDESVGFVRYCAGPGGAVRDETLIGTPDITKGYLLEDATNQALYKECFDTGGIYTALGCIDPTPTGIITGLIRIALGVMGGVALLQMIWVGILYQQGNTEKIKGARTQLIATLTGVAVIVFSVLILRIIGVNVLDVLSVGSV